MHPANLPGHDETQGDDSAEPDAPDAWGIHQHWVDTHQRPVTVPADTMQALREVIGTPPDDLEQRAPIVTRPGRDLGLGRVEVACEDGTDRVVDGALDEDFPLGYHDVRTSTGRVRRLIVSPGRCWLPADWRAWGWTVQLYAVRSHSSWGMGDLADLGRLRTWAQSRGAGFLLVNPLHAVAPTQQQEDSPYLPATRRFRNPLYLALADVPGADRVDLQPYAEEGSRLNDAPLVDRNATWRLKRSALEAIFAARPDGHPDRDQEGPGSPSGDDFEGWRARQGNALEDFATWCVLAEERGPDWRAWPIELRQPRSPAVQNAVQRPATARRVTFYAWLQWLLENQLRNASRGLKVIQDLPIGVHGGGADTWAWPAVAARGVSVGAPPDMFNAGGQDWGSPPLIPWRLRDANYQPFVDSIRATMAAGGGIRIDHVMGLFRLWWVPAGTGPTEGAYVRYPAEDLLEIVALESHRSQSLVIGEDLGTVEPGVREALAEHGILSYKLLWFEADDPATWSQMSMAAVTTHDLPTVAGLWSGSDLDEQQAYTPAPAGRLEAAREELLRRLAAPDVLAADASTGTAVLAAHRRLARSPSTLVAAALEDAVGEERRPNLPGTVARPNWRIPLPVPVDELPAHPGAEALAVLLGEAVAQKPVGNSAPV